MTMILSAVVILAMCWALVKKYETRLVLIAGGLILACMAGDPLAPLVSFSKSMKQANVFEVIIASMGFAAVVKMTGLHSAASFCRCTSAARSRGCDGRPLWR